jgi:hypothetical protein
MVIVTGIKAAFLASNVAVMAFGTPMKPAAANGNSRLKVVK